MTAEKHRDTLVQSIAVLQNVLRQQDAFDQAEAAMRQQEGAA
jgi:hypothetical protein